MYKCSLFCSFYKGSKFIDGYIENILEQTMFLETEFIFLDCASPENEGSTIIPLSEKYKNIKYYRLNKDPGLYAGWNEAIKLCSSDIIGNWNIDDRKNRDGLEILIHKLEKDKSIDIIYGLTYISRIANEKYIDNHYEEIYPCLPHSLKNLINNNSPHCMPLWRKRIHDSIGYFDTNYKSAADGDLWLRCAVSGCKIVMVNHPVGLYYENPSGRSTNPETLLEMVREVQSMRSKYLEHIR